MFFFNPVSNNVKLVAGERSPCYLRRYRECAAQRYMAWSGWIVLVLWWNWNTYDIVISWDIMENSWIFIQEYDANMGLHNQGASRIYWISGCQSSVGLAKVLRKWSPDSKLIYFLELRSGYVKIAIENGPFIVDFPINSMVIFQFAMLVYQRVPKEWWITIKISSLPINRRRGYLSKWILRLARSMSWCARRASPAWHNGDNERKKWHSDWRMRNQSIFIGKYMGVILKVHVSVFNCIYI